MTKDWIKNTATTRAELYKLLNGNNMIMHKSFWPNPVLNREELLTNPAATSVTVYTRDGSDYEIYISNITEVLVKPCSVK